MGCIHPYMFRKSVAEGESIDRFENPLYSKYNHRYNMYVNNREFKINIGDPYSLTYYIEEFANGCSPNLGCMFGYPLEIGMELGYYNYRVDLLSGSKNSKKAMIRISHTEPPNVSSTVHVLEKHISLELEEKALLRSCYYLVEPDKVKSTIPITARLMEDYYITDVEDMRRVLIICNDLDRLCSLQGDEDVVVKNHKNFRMYCLVNDTDFSFFTYILPKTKKEIQLCLNTVKQSCNEIVLR